MGESVGVLVLCGDLDCACRLAGLGIVGRLWDFRWFLVLRVYWVCVRVAVLEEMLPIGTWVCNFSGYVCVIIVVHIAR